MERLPDELLISIGRYTQESWCPTKSFRSLSLCSRRLHAVFQPLLYSHLSPQWSIQFLRLIIRLWRYPERASQVRHLELAWTDCDDKPCHGFEEDEVVEFVDHALDEIFDPEEDESRTKWREHLLVPCEEAWLGLLLVRLTRLERITFGQEDSQLMSDIFRKAARHQRPFHQTLPFPHLREVLVDVQWSKAWVGSDFLTPFFYLPAVRRISGGPIGESDPEDLDKMSFGTSNSACPVREFTITEAWWCRGMFDWLAACTELEHITIVLSHHRDDLELPDSDMFKAPDFRNALLPFTGTLKTLQIEAHPRQTFHGDWWSNIADHTGPFGSFKEFAVLESLRIRHAHLGLQSTSGSICVTGGPLIDILPSSLRSLEILEIDEDEYLNLVEEFSHLIQCRASFPRLAQIILYVEEAAEDVFEPLKHEYGIAGINFQIDTKLPDW